MSVFDSEICVRFDSFLSVLNSIVQSLKASSMRKEVSPPQCSKKPLNGVLLHHNNHKIWASSRLPTKSSSATAEPAPKAKQAVQSLAVRGHAQLQTVVAHEPGSLAPVRASTFAENCGLGAWHACRMARPAGRHALHPAPRRCESTPGKQTILNLQIPPNHKSQRDPQEFNRFLIIL